MKISFQYGTRISQYVFEDNHDKHSAHRTIIDNDSLPNDDEIRIDLWKDESELRKYKEIFSENKIFANLFVEELYCEVFVCSQNENYSREHLGRLSVVWDWLRGLTPDLLPPDSSMMSELGYIQYDRLKKIKDKLDM